MAHTFVLQLLTKAKAAQEELNSVQNAQKRSFETAMKDKITCNSTIPTSFKEDARNKKEKEDEEECATWWPFEFQTTERERNNQKEYIRRHQEYLESEKSELAQRRRKRESRALELQVDHKQRQCLEFEEWQTSFAHNAANKSGRSGYKNASYTATANPTTNDKRGL
jgi:hypothetical protein